MARKTTLGRTYPTWLKVWRRGGAEKWPEVIRFIAVHWTDAAHAEDSENSGTVETIVCGLLKSADDDQIVLAMECFDDRDTRTHLTVPARMVNRVIDIATIRAFNDERPE